MSFAWTCSSPLRRAALIVVSVTRQKNVRQKNKRRHFSVLHFSVWFVSAPETMIEARRVNRATKSLLRVFEMRLLYAEDVFSRRVAIHSSGQAPTSRCVPLLSTRKPVQRPVRMRHQPDRRNERRLCPSAAGESRRTATGARRCA